MVGDDRADQQRMSRHHPRQVTARATALVDEVVDADHDGQHQRVVLAGVELDQGQSA
jgi:hypothetical protein